MRPDVVGLLAPASQLLAASARVQRSPHCGHGLRHYGVDATYGPRAIGRGSPRLLVRTDPRTLLTPPPAGAWNMHHSWMRYSQPLSRWRTGAPPTAPGPSRLGPRSTPPRHPPDQGLHLRAHLWPPNSFRLAPTPQRAMVAAPRGALTSGLRCASGPVEPEPVKTGGGKVGPPTLHPQSPPA